jgi:integrase
MRQYPVTHNTEAGIVIERGPNQFFIRLYIGKAADGTRKYYSKTWKTLERATQDLLEQKLNRRRGSLQMEASTRFSDYLQQYLTEVHRPGVSANTYVISAQSIRNYLNPYPICGKRLKDLTTSDFQQYFNYLTVWVSPLTGRTLASATISRLLRTLTAALNYAVNSQLIARNPMKGVVLKLSQSKRTKRGAFSATEIKEFLAYIANSSEWWIKKLGPLFHLAAETGLRPEEYLGLQWKDVRLNDSPPTITVERVVVELKGARGWTFADPKTEKSARTLPITQELAKRLTQHKEVIAELKRRAGAKWQEYNLVFPGRFGSPVWQDVTGRVFRKVCAELGWEKGRFCAYSLRHSMASLALLRNVNLKVISERLGHSSIRTTADIYAHVSPSLQVAATDVIGSVLYNENNEVPENDKARLAEEKITSAEFIN